MEHGEVSQCKRDTERVRDFASKRQRFLGRFQSAIRIAEMPVAVADVGMAEDAHVDAVQFGVVAAAGSRPLPSFAEANHGLFGRRRGEMS